MEITIIGAALGGAAVGASVAAIFFVSKIGNLQRQINELMVSNNTISALITDLYGKVEK